MVNFDFLIHQHVYYLILFTHMIKILIIVFKFYLYYYFHFIPIYFKHNNHHYETFNIY